MEQPADAALGGEVDLNMVIAGLLRDLAEVQTSEQKKWGYKRAASAIRALPRPVASCLRPDGTLERISGIGPASTRVITEVLDGGWSPTVDAAVAASPKAADITNRRQWRERFFSRAAVNRILHDRSLAGLAATDYRGDLQMHSTWSDGSQSIEDIFATGLAHGYAFAAITDHSAGLPIAGGVSMSRFVEQWQEIEALNHQHAGRFTLLRGVEANIRSDGEVDVDLEERRQFDLVVAAPHSGLRSRSAQTLRMIAAVSAPAVHILGHPRGRMYGTRPGVSADWAEVFAAAAAHNVAIEIDGDPSRQDVDFVLAHQAMEAGCLFALDSDAHGVTQWSYTDTAIAHARVAGIPGDRIINCWPLSQLRDWLRR